MDGESGDRVIDSPEKMIGYGAEVAAGLRPGDVLALRGDLGAGKTHFTMGVARGLGCDAQVTSPTFTLVHEYEGGAFPVYHFDFYRMESEDEVLRIGWDEYLAEEAVIIVEWPDKFPGLIPAGSRWLAIEASGGSRRVRWI